jgi:hypothetical protein
MKCWPALVIALGLTLPALPAWADGETRQAPDSLGSAAPRKAAEDSLLFAPGSLALIEAARRSGGALRGASAALPVARAQPSVVTPLIHLSAIVYHAPDDWQVWLNGRRFTPTSAPGPIEIVEVTAGAVALIWRAGPGAKPVRIRLQPNQSFLTANREIVEGNASWSPRTVAGAPRPPSAASGQ